MKSKKTKNIAELKKELKTADLLLHKFSYLDDLEWETDSRGHMVALIKEAEYLFKRFISAGHTTEEITLLVEGLQMVISQCKLVNKYIKKEMKNTEKQMNVVDRNIVKLEASRIKLEGQDED
jgi:hypothetical protein